VGGHRTPVLAAPQHALITGLIAVKVARLSCGFAASIALCAVTLAGRAQAEDLQPTLLVYKAPADCPLVGDFQSSVERRSSRIHFVDEGSHDRELSIFLHKDGDFTVGELRLIEQNGTLRQRSVRFTTCAEAVEGLALIATVSLDPEALVQEPKPVPATPPEATPPAPKPALIEPRRPAPTPAPAHEEKIIAQTDIGAEANAFFRALPETAFGASFFVDVSSSSRHLFSPSIRGAISYAERLGVSGDGDTKADVKFALFSVLGCPLRIGENVVIFRPCASFSGGALYTRGLDTPTPNPSYSPQFSGGGSAVLSVHLSEALELAADAGVGVTFIRDRFGFNDASLHFHQSWQTQALYISTGLGFRLPLP
jgi:hypothetical protein